MRVAQLAELTGTTVRTIRWYHEVGLLPIPQTRYGHRDYDLSHVARVSRIRWLVESGLALEQVGHLLARDSQDTLADLRAAAVVAREQAKALATRIARLEFLIERAQAGALLSPLPDSVAAAYDAIEAACVDEKAARKVREERDFLELAYFRGQVPPAVELLISAIGDRALVESVAAFTAQSEREGQTPDAAEVDRISDEIVDRMRRSLSDQLPEVARTLDLEEVAGLFALFSSTGIVDPAIAHAVAEKVTTEVRAIRALDQ